MNLKIMRNAIAGALLMGTASHATATTMGEHVNGFYIDAAGQSRRGLGVQYFKTGLETGVLFVAYYTFDTEGNGEPVWYTGSALVGPADFSVEMPLISVTGGTFGGADFGTPGSNDPIGNATFTFNECNSVSWSFSGDAGDFSDELVSANGFAIGATPNSCTAYTTTFAECPSWSSPVPGEDRACAISGEITESVTLTNDTLWYGLGRVYIGNQDTVDGTDNEGIEVTIEPGTRMIWGADGNPDAALFVQMGAKLIAEGTANAPIVMAGPESADDAPAGGQQWGGLIFHGRAPVNVCSGTGCAENEVDSSLYGGDLENDDSGVLKYVRVQNAGGDIDQDPERQYNGVAFHGVGRGTVVEYVQVHDNRDDAFEWFGGTVNARYLVATYMGDDGLDWVQGWQGRVQHALVVRNPDTGAPLSGDPRLVEGDGLSANNEAEPRSTPWLSNVTFIGNGVDDGIVVRRGSGVKITNSIVDCGGVGNGIELRDTATFEFGGTPDNLSGNLTVNNTVVGNCDANFSDRDGGSYTTEQWFNAQGGNAEDDLSLDGVFLAEDSPYRAGFPVPYTLGDSDTPLFDDFFQSYGYVGAFSDDRAAWTQGWTLQDMRTFLK